MILGHDKNLIDHKTLQNSALSIYFVSYMNIRNASSSRLDNQLYNQLYNRLYNRLQSVNGLLVTVENSLEGVGL